MKKNYSLKVKIKKNEITEFNDFFSKILLGTVCPEMANAMKSVLLFQKMNSGQKKDWATFMAAHSGILSEAIIENIQKKYVNLSNTAETFVEVRDTALGQELIISAGLSKEATKNINISPEAVLNLVSGINPSKAKKIIERSIDEAGYDE